MHSKILQIGREPIAKDDYRTPDDYMENSDDFADYIGDEITGDERQECVGKFADMVKDVFTPVGRDTLAYRGKDALKAFKQKWADKIRSLADGLTTENMLQKQRLFNIEEITKRTHLDSDYRVDITGWCDGVAYPLGELFEFADSQLEEGDRIFIGAVIDYHY